MRSTGYKDPIHNPCQNRNNQAELSCVTSVEEAARNALDVDVQHANNVRHHNMYAMTELSAVDNFSFTYIFYFACCYHILVNSIDIRYSIFYYLYFIGVLCKIGVFLHPNKAPIHIILHLN